MRTNVQIIPLNMYLMELALKCGYYWVVGFQSVILWLLFDLLGLVLLHSIPIGRVYLHIKIEHVFDIVAYHL